MIEGTIVNEFWNWVQNHIDDFEKLAYGTGKLTVKDISSKIALLDKELIWEIGPNCSNRWQFIISPNGNSDKLSICKYIISLAPTISKWNFLPAKPQKAWGRKMEVTTNKKVVDIDFCSWSYFLTAFDNNSFFDINFVINSDLSRFDLNFLELAGLFVEAELGEELMMDVIDRINVNDENGASDNSELTNAIHLYDHIISIINN